MQENDLIARELFNAFNNFHRLRWKRNTIDGVRFSEVPVLGCIQRSEKGYLTISEISQLLDLASPTVTQMVNSLERKNLVERKVPEHDRRIVEVYLTAQGIKIVRAVEKQILAKFASLARYLGEDDSYTLLRLVERIVLFSEKVR